MGNIKLNEDQILRGVAIGTHRLLTNIEDGEFDRHHASRRFRTWDVDIEGALGEVAASTMLDMTLNNEKGEPDMGTCYQVRTTKYPNGRLIVQKRDSDTDVFILVRGAFGEYEVVGWILGEDAQMARFWDTKFEAFAVPEEHLQPLDKLPKCKD